MRHIWLVITAVVCLAVWANAAEEPALETVNLMPAMKAGEVLHYNVKVKAIGNMASSGASRIEPTYELMVSYTVGKPAPDGSVQVTLVPEKATVAVGGQNLEVSKDIFPKTTALINKKGEIVKLFSSDIAETKIPGITSKNMILLFITNAPSDALKVGSTWKKRISIPSDPDKYDFAYKLEAIESIGDTKTAKVKSEITLIPPEGKDYSSSGFAISNFSLDGGKLVKVHAEMVTKMTKAENKAPSQNEANTYEPVDAALNIDIELVKPAK